MAFFTSMRTEGLLPSPDNTTAMTTADMVPTDNVSSLANHTTSPDQDPDPCLSTTFIAIYFGIRVIFSGFAIFGNMLTIVAVIRFERLQSKTNFLICSLAAADLLGGSMTPLAIVHETLSDQPIFVSLCLIEKTISIISVGTNLLSILWIAIDRYLYIAHPLHYHTWVTRTKTFIVIALTWLFVAAEVSTVFILSHQLKIGMPCKFGLFLSRMAYSGILMPQIGVLAGTTVVFYIGISRIAYKQGKAIAALNQPYDTYEAAMNRQQKKIAKMMVMVLGTYFACYTPQVIVRLIPESPRTVFWLGADKITAIVYWANTWVNPLIYAWRSEDFRVAFRKLLGLKPTNVVTAWNPPAPALVPTLGLKPTNVVTAQNPPAPALVPTLGLKPTNVVTAQNPPAPALVPTLGLKPTNVVTAQNPPAPALVPTLGLKPTNVVTAQNPPAPALVPT